jgi:NCS1 family nucleobase:cation symporter-1
MLGTHPELISVIVLFLSFALLVTNLLANLVASSYAISNLWPSRLGFRSGAVLSALLSVLCMPWTAMSRMDQLAPYLSVYSVAISCIVGIQLVDYFYVNRQRIDIDDLAFRDGQYWFRSGFNPFAFLALLGGLLVNLPWALAYLGVYKIVWMSTVFQFGCMIGPAVSAGIYWLLVRFVGSFYHNNDLYYSTVGGAAMEMKPQAAFKLNNDLALIDALAGNNNSPGKDKDSTSTASTKVFD